MAAKTSKAFREKMQKRKKSMARKGVVIDKKDWSKGLVRLLPAHGEDPAKECRSFFDNEQKKSVTAPMTWGVVDPLWDKLEGIYKTGDKAEKEHAKDFLGRSVEYWVPCIVRGDEGTANSPNVRVFRMPQSVYQYIVDLIIDEDYGEDVTDADEGRDILIKKEGKGIKTEWKADKMNAGPISEDDELYEALVGLSETFDVANHFFRFDFEAYSMAYQGLTGEELPDDCVEALQELADGHARGDEGEEEEEGDDEEEYEEEEEEGDDEEYEDEEEEEGDDEEEEEGDDEEYEEEEEEGDDEEEEEEGDDEEEEEGDAEDMLADPPDGIEFGSTAVEFETEDGQAVGVVQSWSEDPDGGDDFLLAILTDGDDPDEPWLIDVDEVTVVEAEAESDAAEEDEPEEAEPAVSRGTKRKAMPRRPKSTAAAEIRGGKAPAKSTKKKTTRKAPAKSTKKKTTRKAPAKSTKKKTTRKASARSTKKTTRKAPARTTKKKTTRRKSR